jgi:hypothetical protein
MVIQVFQTTHVGYADPLSIAQLPEGEWKLQQQLHC